jgi:polysaccharide deacetylase 2 family uncharacterized protein YibQ
MPPEPGRSSIPLPPLKKMKRAPKYLPFFLLAALLVLLCGMMAMGRWWVQGGISGSGGLAMKARAEADACSLGHPCLAIVIDDIGRDMRSLHHLLSLPFDLSFGILPHAPFTKQSIEAIRQKGREYFIHLPMLPLEPAKITDEAVVLGRDGPLEEALEACLERVPSAAGASNHMGSLFSQQPLAVERVLRRLKQKSMWFLDSRTTEKSQFCRLAQLQGIPCIERDVFLDDPASTTTVQSTLWASIRLAKQKGWAVAIGHPLHATLRALEQGLRESPIKVRRLSMLIRAAHRT